MIVKLPSDSDSPCGANKALILTLRIREQVRSVNSDQAAQPSGNYGP